MSRLTILASLALAPALHAQSDAQSDAYWPQYRGPHAGGVSNGPETVVEWDLESGENVLWRTKLPGLSLSSPIVWGDRLFVTNAVPAEGEAELRVGLYGSVTPVADEGVQRFEVLCLDRGTGAILWSRTAFEGEPAFPRHPKGSFAASTPATDGTHVVAWFGAEGLYCYDYSGELVWKKDLGELDAGWYMQKDASWGFSSSPVIHEGVLYLQADVREHDLPMEQWPGMAPQEGPDAVETEGPRRSFVAALDVKTGKELWRRERRDVPTFGPPTVDVREGRRQLVVNGYLHMGGYDLDSGEELWRLAGGGDIPVPAPVVGAELIYITNAHGRMAPMIAVDAMAEGELTLDPEESEGLVWINPRGGNYMQTPLLLGEFLYACTDAGILTCYDAVGGEQVYRERLGDGTTGFTSSPVACGDRLYFASEEGVVHVVEAGFEFAVVATNDLGEECMATPAIADGVLYYRTRGHLTAIGEKPE